MNLMPNFYRFSYSRNVINSKMCVLRNHLLIPTMKLNGINSFKIIASKMFNTNPVYTKIYYPELDQKDFFIKDWCMPELNSYISLMKNTTKSELTKKNRYYLAIYNSEEDYDKRLKWTINLDDLEERLEMVFMRTC